MNYFVLLLAARVRCFFLFRLTSHSSDRGRRAWNNGNVYDMRMRYVTLWFNNTNNKSSNDGYSKITIFDVILRVVFSSINLYKCIYWSARSMALTHQHNCKRKPIHRWLAPILKKRKQRNGKERWILLMEIGCTHTSQHSEYVRCAFIICARVLCESIRSDRDMNGSGRRENYFSAFNRIINCIIIKSKCIPLHYHFHDWET